MATSATGCPIRNAQIGLYQGGRVVDAVTCPPPGLVLQPPGLSYLVLRQHLGRRADLLGDRGSRAGIAGDR